MVFPDADLKIFLTASPEVRADRRYHEHQLKGDAIDRARTLDEIHERDQRDRERSTSPLVRAPDAVVVDSTAMEAEEVARLVVMLAKGKSAGATSVKTIPISRNPMWCIRGSTNGAQAGVPVPLEADRDSNPRREGWRRGVERGRVLDPPLLWGVGHLSRSLKLSYRMATALGDGQEASGPFD